MGLSPLPGEGDVYQAPSMRSQNCAGNFLQNIFATLKITCKIGIFSIL